MDSPRKKGKDFVEVRIGTQLFFPRCSFSSFITSAARVDYVVLLYEGFFHHFMWYEYLWGSVVLGLMSRI